MQWESKEQHILKCKIVSENEAGGAWDSCNQDHQNHNDELEQKVEKLILVV
jgi:hypothetical protein